MAIEIERRRFSRPMKRALVRLLQGQTYRAAATAEGVDWRNLSANAKRVDGLRALHLKAVKDRWQREGREIPPHLTHKFDSTKG